MHCGCRLRGAGGFIGSDWEGLDWIETERIAGYSRSMYGLHRVSVERCAMDGEMLWFEQHTHTHTRTRLQTIQIFWSHGADIAAVC